MTENRLTRQIDRVALRIRTVRRLWGLSVVWILLAGATAGSWLLGFAEGGSLRSPAVIAGITAVITLLSATTFFATRQRNRLQTARRIEGAFPELDGRLLAALEQRPNPQTGRLGFLQMQVIEQTLTHARGRDWKQTVPTRRLQRAVCGHALCLVLFAAAIVAIHQSPSGTEVAAQGRGQAPLPATVSDYSVVVEPGDTTVERGTPLPVLARFTGRVPPDSSYPWVNWPRR